ncbi:Flagellar motor switch protein FliN [Andreprevotia sp. IGB-42]|uniref:FliM/FliN family flagellar motor switch protein n=1 Tax=Andreprevotia sp. IGB-42 TaxID=2497473 RepID=UPI001357F9D8|nr:FliM/FliN family flagellar motor switch protein [Andreprevotia sp. IGB-42]KAF0813388.1 Flagellar motor switch protein FliN [Andreprevotia sp. IGB-42]
MNKEQQAAAPGTEVTQLIELPELHPSAKAKSPLVGSSMDVIRNVKIRLSARLGEAELSVGELMSLKEGEVLPLEQLLDDPIEILLDGHVVARGQLVAAGDCFGVQLTELPKRED